MSIKIETKQCERCFAETFQGQLECDVCGLILEGAGKADRTKIAERRKTALHKLGLYYDFKGEYLQSITQHQLESLGLLGRSRFAQTCQEQARESFEPYLGMTLLQKGSRKMQPFAGSVLNEGENEYGCPRYDLLWAAHLPKPDRTKAQVRLGISEQSQLEHNAMRLVYLDFPSRLDVQFFQVHRPAMDLYVQN